MQGSFRPAALVFAIALAIAAAASLAAQEAQEPKAAAARATAAGSSVADILGEGSSAPETAGAAAAADSAAGGVAGLGASALRLLGWALALVGLGAGALLLLRRWAPFARAIDGGGLVRILGRTALSPRHSVFLVKVAGQRVLVLGVSGDRMVTLSEIAEPAGVLAVDGGFRSELQAHEASFGADAASAVEDNESGGRFERAGAPAYLREMDRVRGLLGHWRGILGRRVRGLGAGPEAGESRLGRQEI